MSVCKTQMVLKGSVLLQGTKNPTVLRDITESGKAQ